MSLKIKLERGVPAPVRGSPFSAGLDIHANEEGIIPSGFRSLVSTGLRLEIPLGCYGRIAPRSSLAFKHCVDVCAGVIDQDYRGEVKVLLANHSKGDFVIKKGDRIAQLILEKYETPPIEIVRDLKDTDRGEGGFGSTGK